MSVVLQISDTHFGTEQAPVVSALLRLAQEHRPDVALFSGDITQRARSRQFAAARQFVAQLPVRHVLAIPGNHDVPLYNVAARMFWPYSGFIATFGKNLQPRLQLPDALIVCVNTTRPHRHKHGEVSPQQIQEVARLLERSGREQLRIIATHQPVHVVRPNDERHLVRGYGNAVRAWAEAGADLIVGGHIHLPHLRALSDRCPNLPRRGWSLQAGTALSHRVRGNIPNSVNLICYQEPLVCSVERWDYNLVDRCFEPVETHRLELDRPGRES